MIDIKKENVNLHETASTSVHGNLQQEQSLKKDKAYSSYNGINDDISITETANISIKGNIKIPYKLKNIFGSVSSKLTFQLKETWKTNVLTAIIRRNSNIYKNIFPEEILNMDYLNKSMTNTITSTNDIRQENHELSVGDFVYLDDDNRYKKALAENSIKSNVKGIVSRITGPNIFTLMNSGKMEFNHLDYTDTTILYLSDKIPGKVVHYSEIDNTIYIPVAIYIDNNIIINLQQGSIGDTLAPYEQEEQIFEVYTEEELNDVINQFKNKVIA